MFLRKGTYIYFGFLCELKPSTAKYSLGSETKETKEWAKEQVARDGDEWKGIKEVGRINEWKRSIPAFLFMLSDTWM